MHLCVSGLVRNQSTRRYGSGINLLQIGIRWSCKQWMWYEILASEYQIRLPRATEIWVTAQASWWATIVKQNLRLGTKRGNMTTFPFLPFVLVIVKKKVFFFTITKGFIRVYLYTLVVCKYSNVQIVVSKNTLLNIHFKTNFFIHTLWNVERRRLATLIALLTQHWCFVEKRTSLLWVFPFHIVPVLGKKRIQRL